MQVKAHRKPYVSQELHGEVLNTKGLARLVLTWHYLGLIAFPQEELVAAITRTATTDGDITAFLGLD